jgi:putative FmdB family regulatory protein
MPLYQFKCKSCNSNSDWFGRYSSRPETIDCSQCGQQASYKISVSMYQSNEAAALIEKQKFKTNEENWSGVAWHSFICEDCGDEDLQTVDFKNGEDLSPRECIKCTGKIHVQIEARIDRFSERFPYFDKGLGCWLKSKAHRRQVCKERGLVPVGGDYDFDKQASKQASTDEKNQKGWEALNDKYENSPAFKKYRIARDKGMIDA